MEKGDAVRDDSQCTHGTPAHLACQRCAADKRKERIEESRKALEHAYATRPDDVQRYNARMARFAAARKRERQRVEHLVLGADRPTEKVMEGKRKGRRKPRYVKRPSVLPDGIEQAVTLREVFGYGSATPETARAAGTHQGAIAQLHRNGVIDDQQLEWAAQIANVYRTLTADVDVSVSSLEARIDESRGGREMVGESTHRVRMHLAYGYWRDGQAVKRQMVLDMLVGDTIGYTVAAHRHRCHKRRAKKLLIDAINAWPDAVSRAFRLWSDEEIEQAQNAA